MVLNSEVVKVNVWVVSLISPCVESLVLSSSKSRSAFSIGVTCIEFVPQIAETIDRFETFKNSNSCELQHLQSACENHAAKYHRLLNVHSDLVDQE